MSGGAESLSETLLLSGCMLLMNHLPPLTIVAFIRHPGFFEVGFIIIIPVNLRLSAKSPTCRR